MYMICKLGCSLVDKYQDAAEQMWLIGAKFELYDCIRVCLGALPFDHAFPLISLLARNHTGEVPS